MPGDGSAQPGHLKRINVPTIGLPDDLHPDDKRSLVDNETGVASGSAGASASLHSAGQTGGGGGLQGLMAGSREACKGIPVSRLKTLKPSIFRGPLATQSHGLQEGGGSELDSEAAASDRQAWHGLSRPAEPLADRDRGGDASFTGVAKTLVRPPVDFPRSSSSNAPDQSEQGGRVDAANPGRGRTRLGGPTVGEVLDAREEARARSMIQGGARYGGVVSLHRATKDLRDDYNAASGGS